MPAKLDATRSLPFPTEAEIEHYRQEANPNSVYPEVLFMLFLPEPWKSGRQN